jgi:coproporphyrinogen III oxidase
MSLPHVQWVYDHHPEAGSEEISKRIRKPEIGYSLF